MLVPRNRAQESTKGLREEGTKLRRTVEVSAATAKMRLVQLADEIISVLVSDPNASVKVVVEISAEFPEGAKDGVKRAVSENARTLGLKSADWE